MILINLAKQLIVSPGMVFSISAGIACNNRILGVSWARYILKIWRSRAVLHTVPIIVTVSHGIKRELPSRPGRLISGGAFVSSMMRSSLDLSIFHEAERCLAFGNRYAGTNRLDGR